MNQIYLTVTKDGSFNLLPYLPNKKYFTPETKIFELPNHTTLEYIYKLIGQGKKQDDPWIGSYING